MLYVTLCSPYFVFSVSAVDTKEGNADSLVKSSGSGFLGFLLDGGTYVLLDDTEGIFVTVVAGAEIKQDRQCVITRDREYPHVPREYMYCTCVFCVVYTVEPLIVDPPNKGHNRNNLSIKDDF